VRGQRGNNCGKTRFVNEIRGIFDGKPTRLALSPFGPGVQLAPDVEEIDQHLAKGEVRFGALPVQIFANGLLLYSSFNPRFLECFLGGRLRICAAFHRPSLGNDPASGLARRDEEYAGLATVIAADRECRDLR